MGVCSTLGIAGAKLSGRICLACLSSNKEAQRDEGEKVGDSGRS